MTFELRLEHGGIIAQGAPLLAVSDLAAVKAATRSAWFVLSGTHKSAQIVLTVKRASLERWLSDVSAAVRRGDRVAIMVDGKPVGTMVLMRAPTAADFDIDAAFFANGTEDEKAAAAQNLASAIRKNIR